MLSWRPTEADLELLDKLENKLGLRKVNIIRLAIRRLAEAEGILSNAAD